MKTNPFIVGEERISPTFFLLKKIFRMPKSLSSKKTTAPPKILLKPPPTSLVITKVEKQKLFGHKMKKAHCFKSFAFKMNIMKQDRWQGRFLNSLKKESRLEILRFFIAPMRNRGCLKKS